MVVRAAVRKRDADRVSGGREGGMETRTTRLSTVRIAEASRFGAIASLLLVVGLLGLREARAQVFTSLFDFCHESGCTDGQNPSGGLLVDRLGRLFGTTMDGGRSDQGGTVFEVFGGTGAAIYNFCSRSNCADGAHPWGQVVADGVGNLYGTTSAGGAHG
jgi:hypothetical protein